MPIVKSTCKTCENCPNCFDLDIEKIREYIFAIDLKIQDYSKSILCVSEWGYACSKVTKDEFEKLHIFRGYLEKYYDSLRLDFEANMCPKEIQAILEATSQIISNNFRFNEDFSNVVIDNTNFDKWVIENPYCIAYEDWEKSFAKVCPNIGVNIKLVKEDCNFVYETVINKEDETSCKILTALSVVTIANNNDCLVTDIDVTNLASCKNDYNIIVEKYNCDLKFDEYVSLLECNMSNEVISNLLECDVKLGFSTRNNQPTIKTTDGVGYDFTKMSINIFENNVDDKSLYSVFGVSKKGINKGRLTRLVESYTNPSKIYNNVKK